MGIADFLFEGRAPPATTTYGTRTDNIPQWMSDYTQGLIARANAVAAEPYQLYGGPRIAGFTPDTQRAFEQTRQSANAFQSPLTQAFSLTNQATQRGGLSSAAPYMDTASRTFPTAVQQYMDPYQQHVTDRASELAARTFREQLMPSIDSRFIRSGQYGSSAMQESAQRAARDVTEQLQQQAASQLSQGYQTAGQLFGQDQARTAGLAQLAGQLGGQEQAALLQAGQQYGNLGQLSQQLGLQGASALDTIGQMQQGLNQRNLDVAYQDFVNQTQFPRQTIDWMSSVIRGLPTPTSSQTTQVGPASVYQPSPLAQLGSAFAGVAGLRDLLGRGG